MGRRGLLAELVHQAEKRDQAAVRKRRAAAKRAVRAHKIAERERASAARAAEVRRKQLGREAVARHLAARQAEVDERNAELAVMNEQIESLLAATLTVDDYVDLESLRRVVDHPPFARADLERSLPFLTSIADPAEPVLAEVPPPSGLASLFGGKKKHALATAAAEADFAAAQIAWRQEMAEVQRLRESAKRDHAQLEALRLAKLADARTGYEQECAAREAEVAEYNASLDTFIANLGYGAEDAVQAYVSMVLANSEYPEHFDVDHDATFEPSTAELRLRAIVPPPDSLSEVKAYKYVKASDEITETTMSQKACKDRYASGVHQVALRSLHEVFEADRRGLIKTISLEVGTETADPATGLETYIPFVAVSAERDAFLKIDLRAVVPAATLQHLGATVSKNPHALTPVDAKGVRRS